MEKARLDCRLCEHYYKKKNLTKDNLVQKNDYCEKFKEELSRTESCSEFELFEEETSYQVLMAVFIITTITTVVLEFIVYLSKPITIKGLIVFNSLIIIFGITATIMYLLDEKCYKNKLVKCFVCNRLFTEKILKGSKERIYACEKCLEGYE